MPQTITTSVQALVDATEREIETLNAEQAVALHGRDDVVFVDLRDTRELQREGKVPGCRERHLSEASADGTYQYQATISLKALQAAVAKAFGDQ